MSARHFAGLVLLCLQILVAGGAAAAILHTPPADPDGITAYEVVGVITPSDDFKFPEHIVQQPFVILDSRGGDLATAMKLGREMRKANARAIVRDGEHCVSACVYVLAGAVDRYIETRAHVGIHRPYPLRTGQETRAQAQQEYDRIRSHSRQYFKEMNVAPSLLQAMLTVPPEHVRYLDQSELQSFGLSGLDPVYEYQQNSEDAARYGISRSQLLSRKDSVHRECTSLASLPSVEPYLNCSDSIMWGLSVAQLKRRQGIASKYCALAKQPDYAHYLKCKRSIMKRGLESPIVRADKSTHRTTLKDLGLDNSSH